MPKTKFDPIRVEAICCCFWLFKFQAYAVSAVLLGKLIAEGVGITLSQSADADVLQNQTSAPAVAATETHAEFTYSEEAFATLIGSMIFTLPAVCLLKCAELIAGCHHFSHMDEAGHEKCGSTSACTAMIYALFIPSAVLVGALISVGDSDDNAAAIYAFIDGLFGTAALLIPFVILDSLLQRFAKSVSGSLGEEPARSKDTDPLVRGSAI